MRRIALCLLTVLATACGSTVQTGRDGAPGPRDELAAPAAPGASDGPADDVAGALRGTASSDSPEDGSATVEQDGREQQAGQSTGRTPSPDRPPTDRESPSPGAVEGQSEELAIGLVVDDGDPLAATGVGGGTGSQRNQAQAVVDDINRRGGVLGRTVRPVFFGYNSTSTTPPEQQDQSACTHFTEDDRVFAVAAVIPQTTTMLECLARGGVPYVNDGIVIDEPIAARLAEHLYTPGSFTLERMMHTQFDALERIGFLESRPRVGILLMDTPDQRRVLDAVVLPRLAALGIEDPVWAASPPTLDGLANQQGNVLRFRSEGVTHVLTIGQNPVFFMQQAEGQAYRPDYAVYSNYMPLLRAGAVPAGQLEGSVGFGWNPTFDVNEAQREGMRAPGDERCLDAMAAGDQDMSQDTARALAAWWCDALWFVEAALTQSGQPTVAGLAGGARTLEGYRSPVTWELDMRSGRPDGVSRYRELAYRSSCGCFEYASGLLPTR